MVGKSIGIGSLIMAAGLCLAAVPSVGADRVVTDPSGQRLLLRGDGTYTTLPPSVAAPEAPASGTVPARPMSPFGDRTPVPAMRGEQGSEMRGLADTPGPGTTPPAPPGAAGPRAPSYQPRSLEELAASPAGELVMLRGWIGNVGGGPFLMFRDRTVSPPYVVVRMPAGDGRGGREWAEDLNQRCQDPCSAAVTGEVIGHPQGGAPEILAHHVDVTP